MGPAVGLWVTLYGSRDGVVRPSMGLGSLYGAIYGAGDHLWGDLWGGVHLWGDLWGWGPSIGQSMGLRSIYGAIHGAEVHLQV